MPDYLYDVALSFAGTERDYVRQVAVGLKSAGHSIFFDEDEEVSLWGENLIERLDEVYRKQARFVAMFVSKEYAARVWTRLERRSALTRALEERSAYVLPTRFDDTELPGLLPSVAYLNLRGMSPDDLVKRIVAKTRIRSHMDWTLNTERDGSGSCSLTNSKPDSGPSKICVRIIGRDLQRPLGNGSRALRRLRGSYAHSPVKRCSGRATSSAFWRRSIKRPRSGHPVYQVTQRPLRTSLAP